MKIQQKQACAHSHPVPLLHASTYPSPERWPLPQLDPAVAATSSIEGQSLVAPVVVNGEERDGAATGTRGRGDRSGDSVLDPSDGSSNLRPVQHQGWGFRDGDRRP